MSFQPQLILFDWGGTLADVAGQPEALDRGSRAAAAILGVTEPDATTRLVHAVMTAERKADADPTHREADMNVVLADWAADGGSNTDPDRLAQAADALGNAWVGSLQPIDGALEAVRTLRDRGIRLGLVSNCAVPPRFCHQELARQGFAALLDFAIFSSEVGYRKPASAIYEAALRAAGPQGNNIDLSSVLFVGDSPAYDVMVPASMGMRTALVAGKPGLWSAEDYGRAKPDLHLDRVAELPRRLNYPSG